MSSESEATPQFERAFDGISRRALLKSGLAAAAGGLVLPTVGALPARAADLHAQAHAFAPDAVMTTLAEYMKDAQTRALPVDAAEHTRLHVLDTLAAMISGSELAPGRAALNFVHAYGGGGDATVVRSNALAGPIEAALANAMMAHADETDDSHAPSQSHPGCAIVPAALAAGERFGTDGPRFLRAVALGYDIGTRVNMTLRVSNFEVGSHQSSHAIAGILGLGGRRWMRGRSLKRNSFRGCSRTPRINRAAHGVAARYRSHSEGVRLRRRRRAQRRDGGARGALGVDRRGRRASPGKYNFLLAYAPGADLGPMVEKLGERYEVTRTNIKKWTVGSPIQAPLDALEIMRKKHPFEADQVQRVVVRVATSEAGLVDNREMPDISMQHMLAVMLLDKTASFASAHDKARMQDPRVRQERAKVTLVPDAELEKLLPKRVAIVEVTFMDGTMLTERVDAVRGPAQNPMTRDEIVAKARDLMAPVLGADATSRLIEKVLALDTTRDIRELRPLLQGARAG